MGENQHTNVQQFEYKAEMKQLLHLIIHSLYTHPEVFLRELISNASDALNKVRFMQITNEPVFEPEAPLKITIEIDGTNRNFSIEDSGIGMTREDLIDRIGTVASSGTLEYLQKMKSDKAEIDGNLIGQFGVGFYSVFMVADDVVIETRHASPDAVGLRWTSSGEGTFAIEQIDRRHRGTRIFFKLKEDHAEFAEEWRVKGVIRKYSNFVDFPIHVGAEQVNAVAALWHRGKGDVSEEERNEFYKFLSGDHETPLGHLHLAIEGRVNFKALVFVPRNAPPRLYDWHEQKSLHLYSNKVFIQDDCKELLPDYLHFLKGVVDTEDLPLNVSREVTQSSPVMAKIRDVLAGRVLTLFEEWASEDAEKYTRFFEQFGPMLKSGITSDFTYRDRLIALLRFNTTKTGKGAAISLREYVDRMHEEHKEIYYVSGEHRDVVERNPKLEYFRKHDIEVLLLSDPIDVFLVPGIHEFDGKSLVSIEKADLELKREKPSEGEAVEGREAKALLIRFKEVLGSDIEDVAESHRLVDSAATLVTGKTGMDPQMERMIKMMDASYASAKRILEINMSHPLIRNLARLCESHRDEALLEQCIRQVYEGALLIEDNLQHRAEFVSRMTDLMVRTTRG